MAIESKMAEFQQKFTPQLKSFFAHKTKDSETSEEKQLWAKMRDYTLVGGKRIRPFLLWQMLEKTRDEIQGLPDVLVGIELLHNSTLIEDDIVDHHSTRRNRPTLRSDLQGEGVNGEHLSLIAAGLMRCSSLNLIQNANISDKFKKECINAYNQISTAVNEGQALDVLWTGRLDVSETDLLLKAEKVAARFIEYMFRLGVEEESLKESWAEIGLHLGIVFQLVDDLLDIDNHKNKGREVGDDIRMGKPTPLIVTAYNNLYTKSRQRFETNFGNPHISREELEWMIERCKTTGAIEHVRDLIKRRLGQASSILSSLDINHDHWIHELNKFSVERNS